MFVKGGNAEPEGRKTARKLDWSVAGGPNGFSGLLTGSF
jgi:hypothetical protein